MYLIAKEFHFSASHQLNELADDHPCKRLHGHNYIVTLILKAENLNKYNFVKDYRELDFFKKYIDNHIDHRHLNEIFGRDDITSEFLAKYFFDWCHNQLPELYAVRVYETPKSWAQYGGITI